MCFWPVLPLQRRWFLLGGDLGTTRRRWVLTFIDGVYFELLAEHIYEAKEETFRLSAATLEDCEEM